METKWTIEKKRIKGPGYNDGSTVTTKNTERKSQMMMIKGNNSDYNQSAANGKRLSSSSSTSSTIKLPYHWLLRKPKRTILRPEKKTTPITKLVYKCCPLFIIESTFNCWIKFKSTRNKSIIFGNHHMESMTQSVLMQFNSIFHYFAHWLSLTI